MNLSLPSHRAIAMVSNPPNVVESIGFTGTQIGMTPRQFASVAFILSNGPPGTLHYGCCIGADAEAYVLATKLGFKRVAHPPIDRSKVAPQTLEAEEVRPDKDYLVRNHDIVDECNMLIATPSGPEKLRSGTWATIRYAKKIGRDTAIVSPDGSVTLS